MKLGLSLLGLLLGLAGPLRAESVLVGTAANFAAPLQRLADSFERDSGHRVKIAVGSSAKLYAQIQRGAPLDLFFSADQDKANKLSAQGFAVAGSQRTYALGRLVLWSAKENNSLEKYLRSQHRGKLAIANPLLAPYGRAAVETLQSLKLEQQYQGQLIRGENIGQTFQFLHTGAASMGFIAQSQWQQGKLKGAAWLVPPQLHQPIRQDFVLLKRAANNAAAKDFWAFVISDSGRRLIAQSGYELAAK
ncbi:MAG: molybdate ABC transporter substrate-binding protein [Cellvibrionaceae bacterium]|nr:molybdate ABC transporter substrate-binding protein [Cellvibrionaceae bacterium]MCV6624844.1 molybdate ABC transporter substrate-binding protein [Cellvibrionaceae bacterium]